MPPEHNSESPRPSASIRGSKSAPGTLLLAAETDVLIGAAMEVLNTLGHGLLEKPYENALVVELGLRGVPWAQQPRYDVVYKSVKVGEYIPDLITHGCVVVEAKVIDRITDHELGQMINYLKITRQPVGLILNFKNAKLEWRRVVNTSSNHG